MLLARRNPRHALATLAWGIALFGVCVLSAEFVFPHWLELFRDCAYEVRRDRMVERLTNDCKDPYGPSDSFSGFAQPELVVTLGSSRTAQGIDGELAETQLESALGRKVHICNLGVPGGTPYNFLVILGRLLREGLKPDVIVVEILPSYLAGAQRDIDSTLKSMTLTDVDRSVLRAHGVAASRAESPEPALWKYRTVLLKTYAPILVPKAARWRGRASWDEWGSTLYTPPSDVDLSKGLADTHAGYSNILADFELRLWGTEGYRKLLQECRSHDISVVLVLMPEGPEFRSWYREGARFEILEYTKSLAAEFGCIFPDTWECVDEEYFVDSHHLTAKGAAIYTRRLVTSGVVECLSARRQLREAQTQRHARPRR